MDIYSIAIPEKVSHNYPYMSLPFFELDCIQFFQEQILYYVNISIDLSFNLMFTKIL